MSLIREPVLYMSSGQLRFDAEAWKRNLDFRLTSCLHRMALRGLRRHLQDLAEAEAERNAASATEPAAQSEEVSVVSLSGARPARRRVSPAEYAEGSRSNLHWDLVEYVQTLDNLTDELVPVMVRSRRFAAVCGPLACLWNYGRHPQLGFIVAVLALYNVGFALAYMCSLPIVSRSRRGAEALRQKVKDRNLSQKDADTWAGPLFRATNWIADERHARRYYYGVYGPGSLPWWCPWPVTAVLKLASF